MPDPDDIALLQQYAKDGSEAAFATLVSRHVNLVYSVALQRTGNVHHAEEVAQAVFIILARKAAQLSDRVILSGWLYHTTQLTAANFIRGEIRRARREQEAHMQSILDNSGTETWTRIAPILHDAMARLDAHDRDAIVLRYFENKSLSEMAVVMRIAEPAAHKRLTRAVDRLRNVFVKRGVKLSAAALVSIVAANSVNAAPVGLAASITAATAHGAAVSVSTLTLVKGALKLMAWTKAKMAIVAGVVLLGAAALTPVIVKQASYHFGTNAWRRQFEATYRLNDGEMIRHIKPPFIKARDDYYHNSPETRDQARRLRQAPDYFILRDDGKEILPWGYSFGNARPSLEQVLQLVFQMKTYELEGDPKLLATRMPGDWVIRGGLEKLDKEQVLKELGPVLSKELKRTVRFEKQTVEREVIVASGDYVPVKNGRLPKVDIYVTNLKDTGGGGSSGTIPDFLDSVGDRLYMPVIDETITKDQSLEWRIHQEVYNMSPTDSNRVEASNKLLANIQSQTGISFRRETRPVEVWVVSEN